MPPKDKVNKNVILLTEIRQKAAIQGKRRKTVYSVTNR